MLGQLTTKWVSGHQSAYGTPLAWGQRESGAGKQGGTDFQRPSSRQEGKKHGSRVGRPWAPGERRRVERTVWLHHSELPSPHRSRTC